RRSFMRRRKADATYAYLVASAFGWIASRVRDALMAAVALALAFALIGCGKKGADEEEGVTPAEIPTIVADVAKVTRRTLAEELVVRGTIATVPNEDVKVSALVAGRVNSVSFS